MNELAVLLVASVVSLATRNLPVNAYHYVVPQDSCYNMFPVHNVSESQLRRASPYRILVPKNYYHPLEEMKITLVGESNAQFSGFLLQARLVKTTHIVGVWNLDVLPVTPFVGILKCFDKNNSLIHAWPEFYPSQSRLYSNVTATWQAPNIDNWDIEFVATVVQNYQTFWMDVKSDLLTPTGRFVLNAAIANLEMVALATAAAASVATTMLISNRLVNSE